MAVTIEFRDTTARIILSGDIDYSVQDELTKVSQQAVAAKQVREIQLDCRELAFLDSSVIRALLTLQRDADSAGKTMVFLNCSPAVREVFEIGGFDRMFTFR